VVHPRPDVLLVAGRIDELDVPEHDDDGYRGGISVSCLGSRRVMGTAA
jgi:hypothetical protein